MQDLFRDKHVDKVLFKKYENFAVKCETGSKTNVETNVKMMTVYGVGRNITITDLIKCKVKTSHIYFFKFL